jgi:hypothetical protein
MIIEGQIDVFISGLCCGVPARLVRAHALGRAAVMIDQGQQLPAEGS